MNTLIITYNIDKINIIDYDPVLYLVDSVNTNVRNKLTGKHVSIIKKEDIHLTLISQIEKYYKNFDVIILIDNNYQYNVSDIRINSNIPENWIVIGSLNQEQWKDGVFIPSYYSVNKLMLNCKFLDNSVFDSMKRTHINNISFPYYSRIIYEHYDRAFDKMYKGVIIKLEKCENILL